MAFTWTPPPPRARGSVSAPDLTTWLRTHEAAPGAEVARARLAFMELEGTARFLRGLQGLSSVRPRVLITAQVSGRWSTAEPPLAGLPRQLKKDILTGRGVIGPAYGTFWTAMDMEAIEGRLAATYAQEWRDLSVFAKGGDLHCETAQDIFGEPITYDDPRRFIAKLTRYNLLYAYDARGILDAPDYAVFGGRAKALAFAHRFLAIRPALTAAKQRVFAECQRTHQARSAFGRLRHLTGDAKTQAKDGWSHTIAGTVSSMMNRLLLKWLAIDPNARIILNQHDGCILSWPATRDRQEILNTCRAIADEPWTVWGQEMVAPTQWDVIEYGYGDHE